MDHRRKPGVCATCKGRTSWVGQDRCRTCWRRRGQDTGPVVHTASECGHDVSRIGMKWCMACYNAKRKTILSPHASPSTVTVTSALERGVVDRLKLGARTLDVLAAELGATQGAVLDAVLALKAAGMNVHEFDGRWSFEKIMPVVERAFEYVSRPDNTFLFGSASDAHLCSRYAREDVLGDLYDRFQRAGVDRVVNAGNWIDGEDDKNRFDLAVHGFEPQIKYLVDRFPNRDGITTYSVWGEDHEGWYSRREAIDVGRFAEAQMRAAGRTDWVDLGFIEARIDLVNANTGVKATMVVMHPGGGSSYAYSYRSQKIVESLSGGEKPGVLVIGHYHKLNLNIIRNVWTVQAGTTCDQTVFMRKKGLEAHVGGMVLTLEQDPQTGAIFRCVADQVIYYDRAYHNDRWSKTQPVVQAPRFAGGVVPVGA